MDFDNHTQSIRRITGEPAEKTFTALRELETLDDIAEVTELLR